ncbi:bifunctional riboflavin kinase/FAD synthetase [Acidothermaceae bacterium B102]|nr:bifunctional riboflavin kinase/FAD synthetase [Acidothermaceae bacterium B102]
MQLWSDLTEVPADLGTSVVAIGVFDGVHMGHRVIISRAVGAARQAGVPAVLLTFEPHPAEVVRPEEAPLRLTSAEAKAVFVADLEVDAMLVLAFTPELSHVEPEEFVRAVLHDALHAQTIVVGDNFRFGRRAAGNVEALRAFGPSYGFSVDAVGLVEVEGRTVSSSEIRGYIAAGDVDDAAILLGRLPSVSGPVVRGDARGRELGYPTANLALEPRTAVPADGVYAGWLVRADPAQRLPAAISVGTNPTFDGVERRVEAFVLGSPAGPGEHGYLDLYDEQVRVEFAHRLRGMVRFDSVDDLVVQMARDVEQAAALLAGRAADADGR